MLKQANHIWNGLPLGLIHMQTQIVFVPSRVWMKVTIHECCQLPIQQVHIDWSTLPKNIELRIHTRELHQICAAYEKNHNKPRFQSYNPPATNKYPDSNQALTHQLTHATNHYRTTMHARQNSTPCKYDMCKRTYLHFATNRNAQRVEQYYMQVIVIYRVIAYLIFVNA